MLQPSHQNSGDICLCKPQVLNLNLYMSFLQWMSHQGHITCQVRHHDARDGVSTCVDISFFIPDVGTKPGILSQNMIIFVPKPNK